jgi:sulfonate transport system permease protein
VSAEVSTPRAGVQPVRQKLYRSVELLIVPIVVLIVWTVAVRNEWVHPYLLPTPVRVFRAAVTMMVSGSLLTHLWVSLLRVVSGFVVTLSLAVPLSFIIHALPRVKRLLRFPLEFLRSVPPLAAIPLLILWFGIGEASKTAVIVMASFFPVFLSLLGGLNSVGENWRELARSLQLNTIDFVRYVLFPASLPSFLTGVQLGLSYCWRALMGAEMIAAASGLGYMILDSQQMGRVDRVFVGIVTLGLCGIALDKGLMKAFNALVPWTDLEADQRW